MRKAFNFIKREDVLTPVFDKVSKFIPEQAISLRQLLMEFSYMSDEKVSEIVNRGYFGDEDDDDIIGVDASAFDFTEIHDRMIDLINKESLRRQPDSNQVNDAEPEPEPELEPKPEPKPEPNK